MEVLPTIADLKITSQACISVNKRECFCSGAEEHSSSFTEVLLGVIICFCVLKDSPLLHILEMYDLCMNCKKYSEAKTKLDEFQKLLTNVRICFL